MQDENMSQKCKKNGMFKYQVWDINSTCVYATTIIYGFTA